MENRTDDTGRISGEWVRRLQATLETDADANQSATPDLLFDLFSSSHRRAVLYCLHRRDEPISVEKLATGTASVLTAMGVDEPENGRLQTRLVHRTLPRLDDALLVAHDREAETVAPTSTLELLEPLLGVAATLDFDGPNPLENNPVQ